MASNPWLLRFPSSRPRLRLFCFPYAGGGASMYAPWRVSLPQDVELVAVQLPGREGRTAEAPLPRMAELAERAAEALGSLRDLPFALFGHSMGALLAFEVARRMGEALRPARLFVSGAPPPQHAALEEVVSNLPREELLARLRELNGTPEEAFEHPELLELLLPAIRADFEACETYRYEPGPSLLCPISVYGGLQDLSVPQSLLAAWGVHSPRPVALRLFPGDHFFIHGARPLVLRQLVAELGSLR